MKNNHLSGPVVTYIYLHGVRPLRGAMGRPRINAHPSITTVTRQPVFAKSDDGRALNENKKGYLGEYLGQRSKPKEGTFSQLPWINYFLDGDLLMKNTDSRCVRSRSYFPKLLPPSLVSRQTSSK